MFAASLKNKNVKFIKNIQEKRVWWIWITIAKSEGRRLQCGGWEEWPLSMEVSLDERLVFEEFGGYDHLVGWNPQFFSEGLQLWFWLLYRTGTFRWECLQLYCDMALSSICSRGGRLTSESWTSRSWSSTRRHTACIGNSRPGYHIGRGPKDLPRLGPDQDSKNNYTRRMLESQVGSSTVFATSPISYFRDSSVRIKPRLIHVL